MNFLNIIAVCALCVGAIPVNETEIDVSNGVVNVTLPILSGIGDGNQFVAVKRYTTTMITSNNVLLNTTNPDRFVANIGVIYSPDSKALYQCDLLIDVEGIPAQFIASHYWQSYPIGGLLHMMCDDDGCNISAKLVLQNGIIFENGTKFSCISSLISASN